MPKPCSLMKMSYTITEFINMNLEYLDHCLHVGNFLGFFNPRCPWAQLFALFFSFLDETMGNKYESEVFEKLYMAEVVGRRKLSFFPLRNVFIQFESSQAKKKKQNQWGIIFIQPSSKKRTLEKSYYLMYFTLVIHLLW